MHIGSKAINDFVTFYAQVTGAAGSAADADSAPAYRIYEEATGTPILTGTMDPLDAANTDGFYAKRIQLLAADGFEEGKDYACRILATVGALSNALPIQFSVVPSAAVVAGGISVGAVASAASAVVTPAVPLIEFVYGASLPVVLFNTFGGDGASVTMTGGTVKRYDVTDNPANDVGVSEGITLTANYKGTVGVHHVMIDADFIQTGGPEATQPVVVEDREYMLVLEGATVAGKTVNAAIARFRVVRPAAFPQLVYRKNEFAAGGGARDEYYVSIIDKRGEVVVPTEVSLAVESDPWGYGFTTQPMVDNSSDLPRSVWSYVTTADPANQRLPNGTGVAIITAVVYGKTFTWRRPFGRDAVNAAGA